MNDLYCSSLRPRSVDRCDINGRERARRGRGRSKRRDTRALKSVERRNKIKEKKKKNVVREKMSADSLQRQHLSKGLSAGMQRTLSLLFSERVRVRLRKFQ